MIFFRENKKSKVEQIYFYLFVFFSCNEMQNKHTKAKQNKKLYLDNHCYKCIAPELGACISPFSAVHPGLCHRSSSNCISLLPLFPAQAEVLLSLPRDMILAACLVPKASSHDKVGYLLPYHVGGIQVASQSNAWTTGLLLLMQNTNGFDTLLKDRFAHPVSVIFLFQSLATARGHMWR